MSLDSQEVLLYDLRGVLDKCKKYILEATPDVEHFY
jgi:hypothetical protein